jgi:hypothetical protein
LLFRVVSTDEHLTIAQVLELKPDSAASVATEDPTRQRQWEVSPVAKEGVTLRVVLCLARDDGQRPDARRSLRTDYHYRRFE